MIGIIPSTNRTFEVEDYMDSENELIEGRLYIDRKDDRLYMYSLSETRSNPRTGYYPIWNGKDTIISKISNVRHIKDVVRVDMSTLCSNIDKKTADRVLYNHRKSDNYTILEPSISDGDNMFTQCIKGILIEKRYTLTDLVDLSSPKLTEKGISNYYSALGKIAFMRLEKWNLWMNVILHMNYRVIIYNKEGKKLLTYFSNNDKFDTGIVKYANITKSKEDFLKKIIKIMMIMENITKTTMRSDEIDDYTINNMLTILSSDKPISAQLFGRFIRMSGLSYEVCIYEDKNVVFKYKE